DYPDLREYPDGPPEQPYDAAGWTLPYQMGVNVAPVLAPLTQEFRAALQPVKAGQVVVVDAPHAPFTGDEVAAAITIPGQLTGSGARISLDPAQNNSFRLLNRAAAARGTVRYANGSYIVDGVPAATMQNLIDVLGVQATRTNALGEAAVRARVALYKPWRASMDEGWTRWLFDQYEFP